MKIGSRDITEIPPSLLACVYAVTIPYWTFDSELCMHPPPPPEAQTLLWRIVWSWIKREMRKYHSLGSLNPSLPSV
jgi:hypothetical protein